MMCSGKKSFTESRGRALPPESCAGYRSSAPLRPTLSRDSETRALRRQSTHEPRRQLDVSRAVLLWRYGSGRCSRKGGLVRALDPVIWERAVLVQDEADVLTNGQAVEERRALEHLLVKNERKGRVGRRGHQCSAGAEATRHCCTSQ